MTRGNHKLLLLEAAWHRLGRRPGAMPVGAHRWLRDPGSLTRALVRRCDGHFAVDLRDQGWDQGLPGERRLLGMRRGEIALVREVNLLCDCRPWVFARTLIPASSLRGRARRLAVLGNRPLGAVLFADPTTRRRVVQVARLTSRNRLHARAVDHIAGDAGVLWGRRTLFEFNGKPLLVNEIFLPELIRTET